MTFSSVLFGVTADPRTIQRGKPSHVDSKLDLVREIKMWHAQTWIICVCQRFGDVGMRTPDAARSALNRGQAPVRVLQFSNQVIGGRRTRRHWRRSIRHGVPWERRNRTSGQVLLADLFISRGASDEWMTEWLCSLGWIWRHLSSRPAQKFQLVGGIYENCRTWRNARERRVGKNNELENVKREGNVSLVETYKKRQLFTGVH